MERLLLASIAFMLAAALLPEAADAASRLGGGRSLGAARQATPPQRQATPPSQQQAQPAAPQQQPQPSGPGRWLAPLAGLAAGLGLGWLFAQGGAGALLAVLAMALAAGAVIVLLARLLGSRHRQERAPVQYAGTGNEIYGAAPPRHAGGTAATGDTPADGVPAGFDAEGFLRQAKRNFLALQEANDRGDVASLREVTTPEMYAALAGDVRGHAGTGQSVDVVGLDADLLEVVTEGPLHWASVRFRGTIREDPRALPSPFEEIWHLQKPVDGSSGWLLAGIQQTAAA